MRLIVATDIHGVNDRLRAQLAVLGEPVIVSPWPGEGCPYSREQDAVTAFLRCDGLQAYERRIADAARDEAACLIGFSVGATGLWRYIASARCHPGSRAFLYYGSRIRDHAALVPRCAASLVFAEHEASFDPRALAQSLDGQGVACTVVDGTRHGFMSPASAHYRADIARAQLEMLAGFTRS